MKYLLLIFLITFNLYAQYIIAPSNSIYFGKNNNTIDKILYFGNGNVNKGQIKYNYTLDQLGWLNNDNVFHAFTSGISSHNSLSGLQGGQSSQYYHLDSNNYNHISIWNTALQSELDPIYTNSPAYNITQSNINDWNAIRGDFNTLFNKIDIDNLIDNGYFYFNTNGWIPQTGLTITRSTYFDSNGSALIAKDGSNRYGSYIAYSFSIPSNLSGVPYVIKFDTFSNANQNISVFDYKVTVWDVAGNSDITNVYFSDGLHTNISYGSFVSSGLNYEIRIFCNTTSTDLKSFYIKNIEIYEGNDVLWSLTVKSIYADNYAYNSAYTTGGISYVNGSGHIINDANLIYNDSTQQVQMINANITGTLLYKYASPTVSGLLDNNNFNKFNNKQNALTFVGPIFNGGNNNIYITQATSLVSGFLTSNDWGNFNTAYTNNHIHANKTLLDNINQELTKTSSVQFAQISIAGNTNVSDGVISQGPNTTLTFKQNTTTRGQISTAYSNFGGNGTTTGVFFPYDTTYGSRMLIHTNSGSANIHLMHWSYNGDFGTVYSGSDSGLLINYYLNTGINRYQSDILCAGNTALSSGGCVTRFYNRPKMDSIAPRLVLTMSEKGNVGLGLTGLIMPTSNFQVNQPIAGIGQITNTANSNIIIGTETQFTNTFVAGQGINIGANTYVIQSITNDNSMILTSNVNAANTSVFYNTNNSGVLFNVKGSGNVGIGIENPAYKLHVNGNSFVNGTVRRTGNYAQIYVPDANAVAQTIATGTTYATITALNLKGQNSIAIADNSNNQIILTNAGHYLVTAYLSWTINTVNELRCAAFLDSVEQVWIHFAQKGSNGSATESGAASGIISANSNQNLTLRCRHDNGGSADITPNYGGLTASYIGE